MAEAGPLGPEDLAQMKLGIDKLNEADNQIRKAQSAGIEMGPQSTKTKELREQLTKIRQVYFPGQ